ncbi:terpene synthase family protein [Streptomyces sp. NPDC002537]
MPSSPPPVPGLRVSPYGPEAAAFIERWVRRTGLIQSFSAQRRFRRAGCAAFAARVMPDAECGRLQRGAAWLVWFFILDGRSEECGAGGPPPPYADTLLDFLPVGLVHAPPPRTALERALADAWRMVAPAMSPEWRHRFRTHFGEFVDAWLLEAAGPVRPLLDLVEYTSGHEVPPEIGSLESFGEVTRAAVLSFPGERAFSPEFLASRADALRTARAALETDLAREGLPCGATSYAAALAAWLDGLPRGPERAAEDRRLSLTEDITGSPVDLLRPRRPAPPPVPSAGGGAGALHGGRE